jgi:hypothetical protein
MFLFRQNSAKKFKIPPLHPTAQLHHHNHHQITPKTNNMSCIGRESNPGLAELIFADGNG